MDIITTNQLAAMAGRPPNDNMRSVATSINLYGAKLELYQWRLAHYLAQLLHESGLFKYDEEIASGRAYEGRKDLGNVQPGDGEKFKGRTGIQITGRANYRAFTAWVRKRIDANAPDFERDPDAVNSDPWEGLAPLWYWSTRNLNALADENDIEQITKKINGARNGLADRIANYEKAALVLLGYQPGQVLAFQTWAQQQGLLPPGQDQLDGDAGPKTRSAMHMALTRLNGALVEGHAVEVKRAPVTETKEVEVETPVAVVPEEATKRGVPWSLGSIPIIGGAITWFFDLDRVAQITLGSITMVFVLLLLLRGEFIVRRIKALVAEIGG